MITVWAALESMAARLACEHATDEEIATLRGALPSYRKDELQAHIDEYSEANIFFHQRILELGRCQLLKDIADGLFLHMRAIRERAMAEGDRVRRSVEDHMKHHRSDRVARCRARREGGPRAHDAAPQPRPAHLEGYRTASTAIRRTPQARDIACEGTGFEGEPPIMSTATDTLHRKSRDANVVSGGRLVAKALKAEGVDTIFTLCGGHIIDIYDGCIDEGIRIVDVRHEQTAAHAADGYARQTGKLGCVVTTAGPGCTNAVTGIATAFRSESPVLHIGGQCALAQRKMGCAAGPAARRR